ncbi:hypothetical protein PVAP13_5KG200700 [Panicum virgatum]|uniref:F-box/LRR-repeat protein 15/At3g58940/PEG3-like LRR domain-containing protein n=1 Tax=Panicum virgatum TaxID=38727 RepID=A0A8T0SLG1_PANVG|nr:hypothetical protein PVAP13_5KG200700 [Panicum virgatum]
MDRFVFLRTRKKRRADHGGAVEVKEGEASAHHEGTNLISLLPDCVLGEIVVLLDTEEGARTAILSHRWRYIWHSAPLNLDDRLRFIYLDRECLQVISQILQAHSGPVRCLAVMLRCLAVSVTHFDRMEEIELEDIVVEDASSLERLVMHDSKYGPSVTIPGPTKLKMLGYLGNGFPIIQLGHTIFKAMVPVSLADQFSTVTILALDMPQLKLKVVIGYLSCFPCLEKLHVKVLLANPFLLMYPWNSYKCALRWNPSSPIECLNRSLKTIALQSYGGRTRVLEVMKLCFIGAYTTRWHKKRHRQLNINSRASRHAKFLFVRQCDLPSRFWMDKCFSRKDPFEETMY